jgi:hypothetical protein
MHSKTLQRHLCAGLLCVAFGCGTTSEKEAAAPVATAGARSLSVQQLAQLMGTSGTPIREEDARSIAELWIDYQLLARAAADGDSVLDPALADSALWGAVSNAKAKKWYDQVSAKWTSIPIDAEAMYRNGQILAVRQMQLQIPRTARPSEATEIRRRVDSLRRQITPANFVAMGKTIGADPQSLANDGWVPAWLPGRGAADETVELAVGLTKIGTVSNVISADAGTFIVYRPTFAEAAGVIAPLAQQLSLARAESTYFAQLETASKLELTDNVAPRLREVARDLAGFADSTFALASMNGGAFTARQLVRWINAYPAEAGMQQKFANAPDSVVPELLRMIIRNELFLRQADSAGITVSAEQREGFRAQLRRFAVSAWGSLGVDPRRLPDSVRTMAVTGRAEFNARRVDGFVQNMVNRRGLVLQTPRELREWLRRRYPGSAVAPGPLGDVLQLADRIRISTDSARFERNRKARESGVPPESLATPAPAPAPAAKPKA